MTAPRPKVLIVDDDASFGGMVAEVLREKGYDAAHLAEPERALERVAAGGYAAAVVDLEMPSMGGLELAGRIRDASPDTQVVILTGHGDLDSAVEGIQQGVFDYLQKGHVKIALLERVVRKAVERSDLNRQNRELVARLQDTNRLLKALHGVSTLLAGETHLDRLLDKLLAAAKEICAASAGRVILFGRTHADELVIEMTAGDGGEAIRGARLHPGEGIAALVAEKGETVVVVRAKEHPRYSHRCDDLPTALPGLLWSPLRHGSVLGALAIAGPAAGGFGPDEREALDGLARLAAVAIENALRSEQGINFFTHTCDLLISFLESMDVFYPGHSRGVAALADMATRRIGMSDSDRRNVHFAALLHDIGKVRLDPAVLKSESASPEVRALLQTHPLLGVEILRPVTLWEDILPIIQSHHERWDGKGYPSGLRGEEIPMGGRVVAVADSFDAMTRRTPHSPHRTPEEALAELEACAGTQFDPRIIRLFSAEYREHGDPRTEASR